MMKHKKLKRRGVYPNCKYCNRPIELIGRDGMASIRVEIQKVYYLPREDGPVTVITPSGKKRKGILVNDGIAGYLEHVCKVR